MIARIERALAWWMSAPVDKKTAVLLLIAPTVIAVFVQLVPIHH